MPLDLNIVSAKEAQAAKKREIFVTNQDKEEKKKGEKLSDVVWKRGRRKKGRGRRNVGKVAEGRAKFQGKQGSQPLATVLHRFPAIQPAILSSPCGALSQQSLPTPNAVSPPSQMILHRARPVIIEVDCQTEIEKERKHLTLVSSRLNLVPSYERGAPTPSFSLDTFRIFTHPPHNDRMTLFHTFDPVGLGFVWLLDALSSVFLACSSVHPHSSSHAYPHNLVFWDDVRLRPPRHCFIS